MIGLDSFFQVIDRQSNYQFNSETIVLAQIPILIPFILESFAAQRINYFDRRWLTEAGKCESESVG